MRVIAGKYRGRKLASPEGAGVRPTSDKVKESVFGMIQFDVAGAAFLDLFAGSGSMGIEALSRGAGEVVFADRDASSIALVRRNLDVLGERAEVLHADFETALARLKGRKFDFIFLDPPYKDRLLACVATLVAEYGLLAEGGSIIYEHLYADGAELGGAPYEIKKSKKYGTVGIEVIA